MEPKTAMDSSGARVVDAERVLEPFKTAHDAYFAALRDAWMADEDKARKARDEYAVTTATAACDADLPAKLNAAWITYQQKMLALLQGKTFERGATDAYAAYRSAVAAALSRTDHAHLSPQVLNDIGRSLMVVASTAQLTRSSSSQ